MRCFVGFDTSNYTTSAAACDENGIVIANVKRLLPVKEGEELTLFGDSAGDTLRAAEGLGVSPYVLLSARSARTQRIYLKST